MMLCYADEDSTSSYAHRCMWNVVQDHRKRKKEISCYCLKDTIAYEISFSFHYIPYKPVGESDMNVIYGWNDTKVYHDGKIGEVK